MTRLRVGWLGVLLWFAAVPARPQSAGEDFQVWTEHPRLFLNARRLRLLRRERERQSPRWQQLERLMVGQAQMPEPGFALALYSQISGQQGYCQQAGAWALGPTADLRQLALVFDWCQAALSAQNSGTLAAKLAHGLAQDSGQTGVSAMRDRVLAAVALAGHEPAISAKQIRLAVEGWWRGKVVREIQEHRDSLPWDEMLALAEILHAVRDNLGIDLRDSLPNFFEDLPLGLLLACYPSPYPTAENEYNVLAAKGGGEPDLRRAARARAADLSLVAYDPNSQAGQFLQGWLMRDPFSMRSPLGAPYEFLWANPYQPGLSYYHAPLFFHDDRLGRLFVRSSWDEDATWLGYFDGELQVFTRDGLKIVKQQPASKPIRLGDAAVIVADSPTARLEDAEVRHVFLLGLRPETAYRIDVGEGDTSRQTADAGGIIALSPAPQKTLRIRIREIGR